jgi:hypothetical protein
VILAIRLGILYPQAYLDSKYANPRAFSIAYSPTTRAPSLPDFLYISMACPATQKLFVHCSTSSTRLTLWYGHTSDRLDRKVNLFIEEDA